MRVHQFYFFYNKKYKTKFGFKIKKNIGTKNAQSAYEYD